MKRRATLRSPVTSAKDAGGTEPRAIEDQGFVYGGAIEDPDGHTWETLWMDTNWTKPASS